MRSTSVFRRVAATAAMALVLASGVGAAPSMMGTSVAFATAGNAVTDWNEIAQNAIVVGRPVGSALVLEGIAQAAIYDATVAIEGGYEPFVASPTVDDPASTAAAIAEASQEAIERAVAAGAARESVEVVEIDEVPLAYLTDPAVRIRVKAGGPLDWG